MKQLLRLFIFSVTIQIYQQKMKITFILSLKTFLI